MTSGVILQPSYLPWRGRSELIHDVDVFVLYDAVQYDKRKSKVYDYPETAGSIRRTIRR